MTSEACTKAETRIADLEAALRDAVNSLEWVEHSHPGISGYGVRQDCIAKARAVLSAISEPIAREGR
mgnify:CR=1 FL=1